MYLQHSKEYTQYRLHVSKGNNPQLIKTCFRNRHWWHVSEDKQELINLYWSQLRNDELLTKIQQQNTNTCYSYTATNKEAVQQDFYINLNEKQDTDLQMLAKYIGYLLPIDEHPLILPVLANCPKLQSHVHALYKALRLQTLPSIPYTTIKTLLAHNHLQDNFHLSNKKALFYNISAYMKLLNKDPFNIIPLTFHVQDSNDPYFVSFCAKYHTYQSPNNIWIIKPGENSNRGQGIRVTNCLQEITQLVQSSTHKDGQKKTFIIQKYIQNPLLYQKRKFDVRCFLLVTSQQNSLKGYWYEEGYGRTASSIYQESALNNKYVHLTNDAIQAKGSEYGKYEPGNKLSFADLSKYITKLGADWNTILQTMKDITVLSLQSVINQIDPNRLANTFEVFGLDFMLDDQFKTCLIEINTNPDLETGCCNLMQRIIPQMIDNALRIAVDPVFVPPDLMLSKKKNTFYNENCLQSNRFQLIFDEYTQKQQLDKIYQNSKKQDLKAFDDKEEELE